MKKNKKDANEHDQELSSDQFLNPFGVRVNPTAEEVKGKKTTRFEEIKEENYKTLKSDITFQKQESLKEIKEYLEVNNPTSEFEIEKNKWRKED